MFNAETLREIRNAAYKESGDYYTTISTLRSMASDTIIGWDDVDRIEKAMSPSIEKVNELIKLVDKALACKVAPRLPFAPAPEAPSAEELALIENAWNDYFNA